MMLGYESNLEDVLKKTIKELKAVRKENNNFDQKLELEIETLQWILEIKQIVKNDIHTLQRIILNRINKLNIELKKDRFDKHLTLYGIEILKPCLFLLNLDIEKRNINPR
ncbi:MAG: hypothetical protein MRJ93_09425 [Nitrososphaeraceae archaeon]|nr:hypothetical protein [Nitrososphaeraceae archaeon]